MKNLPDTVVAYQRSNLFAQDTVPAGLLNDHSTKEGVWGLIQVQKGKLEYTIGEIDVHILTPENNGVVEPAVTHHVRPLGGCHISSNFIGDAGYFLSGFCLQGTG